MLSDMQVRALLAKNHVRGRMNSCSLILPTTKKKRPPDSTLLKILDELEVYCSFKDKGCSWIGARSGLIKNPFCLLFCLLLFCFVLLLFFFVFTNLMEKDLTSHLDKTCALVPRVNWNTLKYCGPVHRFCLCQVCNKPLLDPVTMSPCEHSFCRICVDSAANCPSCKQACGRIDRADKTLRALLAELQVQCDKCNDWKGERADIEAHMKECRASNQTYKFEDVDTE